MSKFKFVCEENQYSSPVATRTVEFSAVVLEDILEEFKLFLCGNGYHVNGDLIVYNEEEDLDQSNNYDLSHLPHNYDFSHIPHNNWPFSSVALVCPVCKIDNDTMSKHTCYDSNCPKGNTDANQG
jgi:hypothetical protein